HIASGRYRDKIEDGVAEALLNRIQEADASTDDFTRRDLEEVRTRLILRGASEQKETGTFATPWFRVAAAVLLLAACFIAWEYTRPTLSDMGPIATMQSSSVKA